MRVPGSVFSFRWGIGRVYFSQRKPSSVTLRAIRDPRLCGGRDFYPPPARHLFRRPNPRRSKVRLAPTPRKKSRLRRLFPCELGRRAFAALATFCGKGQGL